MIWGDAGGIAGVRCCDLLFDLFYHTQGYGGKCPLDGERADPNPVQAQLCLLFGF
jgi:hypothetical protein